ncbi:hypothetical protein WJX82_008768 [Trebouxia sp. C0006]
MHKRQWCFPNPQADVSRQHADLSSSERHGSSSGALDNSRTQTAVAASQTTECGFLSWSTMKSLMGRIMLDMLTLRVTLFAHSHYKSNWHSMYSLASNVRHVRWDRVPGFALMHQSGIWFEIFIRNSTLNIAGAVSDSVDTPCNQMINGSGYLPQAIKKYLDGDQISWLWKALLRDEGFGQIPHKIRASMSAEFFVTRARIQLHSRTFYTKLLQYIHQNPLGLTAYSQAVIFEHIWHIMFGEEPYLQGLTIPGCDLYKCELQKTDSDGLLFENHVQ